MHSNDKLDYKVAMDNYIWHNMISPSMKQPKSKLNRFTINVNLFGQPQCHDKINWLAK